MSNKLEHEREIKLLREKHKKHVDKLLARIGVLDGKLAAASDAPPQVAQERDRALAAVKALQKDKELVENRRRKAQEEQALAESVNKEIASELDDANKIMEELRAKATKLEQELHAARKPVTV